ncbi:MAG: hypothetical protein ACRYG8_54610, partial [Janthinobacterium lividum]
YLHASQFRTVTSMARKASSPTKARNSKQTPQSVSSSDHLTLDGKRRGRKQQLQPDDAQPTELFPMDAVFADNEVPEPENADLEKALPAKARRGRKPKASSAPETVEASATDMSLSDYSQTTAVEDVDLTPAATPAKARRKRKIDSQPILPEAAVQAELTDDAFETDASLAGEADAEAPAATSSAAKWNAATGAISFDWPAIEQAAATNGLNQAMAKLLLAARDEGANSRWPF